MAILCLCLTPNKSPLFKPFQLQTQHLLKIHSSINPINNLIPKKEEIRYRPHPLKISNPKNKKLNLNLSLIPKRLLLIP